ncbi:MAG: ferrous iron transport protein A [Lachnospiraceae bacterium]|nr:ferrous iron transport protein A [Lachnospiraceae bacterium]
MTLNEAEVGKEYEIKELQIDGDEELQAFLFSLGCYSGEKITLVDKKKNLVVSIKDARYNIDPDLAALIKI